MAIERVETFALRRELDDRFANAQKWRDSREYCLVRLTTDDGVEGWGECWGPVAGNREIVEEFVAPWLTGRDPRNVEQIHDDLRWKLRTSFHTFAPAGVVSAIDTALWDIRGKARGESVAQLLGGRRREDVRAYATGHFFRDVDDFDRQCDLLAEEARGHVEAGFDALKMKVGLAHQFPWGPAEDVELVRAVREAVGDDVTLMVDANWAYDVATARRVGRALEELDVYFFEEPVQPQQVDAYSRLNDALDLPVAGGECWAFADEFDRVLDAGAVDYVQPDVTSAGGITSMRRIADAAWDAGVQCHPHVFGTGVAIAASLQVLGTIPGRPLLEFDRTPNPIRDELVADPVTNDEDTVTIPDRPGLGINIDESVLERFTE